MQYTPMDLASTSTRVVLLGALLIPPLHANVVRLEEALCAHGVFLQSKTKDKGSLSTKSKL